MLGFGIIIINGSGLANIGTCFTWHGLGRSGLDLDKVWAGMVTRITHTPFSIFWSIIAIDDSYLISEA